MQGANSGSESQGDSNLASEVVARAAFSGSKPIAGARAITRLSDHVINLIAAGEVVERPVAVIRELIDNSLDAGATKIALELIDGGLEMIRVTDNGHGMNRDDALLAFERHATSKLLNPADLESIETFGFRGEALASIGAVAKVRLLTRRADEPLGYEVTLAAGSKPVLVQSAAAVGTTVEVRGLFFNQPARKKFMKLPRTELARVRNHLHAVALVSPGVHFTLKADGKELDNLAPVASTYARARTLLGDELLAVESVGEVIRVDGGVTHPGTPQKSAAITIVNGRVVQDRMILRAIREGYDSMLKGYELPGGFIAISIRPNLVDVNVHPQKSEVRFRDSSAVFLAVRAAVKAALTNSLASLARRSSVEQSPTQRGFATAHASPISIDSSALDQAGRRPVIFADQTPLSFSGPYGTGLQSTAVRDAGASSFATSAANFISRAAKELAADAILQVAEHPSSRSFEPAVADGSATALSPQVRIIGQVLGCYLIGEDQDGLVTIDMHAAHERINFNRIRGLMTARQMPIQELLFPVSVTLSATERAALDERSEYFADFGFRWSPGSSDSVSLVSAPAILAPERLARIFKEALAVCARHDHAQPLQALVDSIAARLACHASVRSGDILTEQESYALLDDLRAAESGGACPHGRPVMRRFSRADVERWFGRDR